jgi:hypothetical protein
MLVNLASRHRVEAARLALCLRPIAGLAQEQEPGLRSCEAGSGGGLGTVTDLLLRKAQAVRAGAQGDEDYDVIGPDGLVIGHF